MSANKNSNGSIMIAALVITLITGTLVGLFPKTVSQEIRSSYRSRMTFQAVNVAEAGLEFGMAAINAGNWTGWWAGAKGGYYRSLTFNPLYATVKRENFRAIVYFEPNRKTPRAVAEGVIRTNNGMEIRRQVYIELGNRSPFANGVLAKDSIKFNGNGIYVDSYMSRPASTHYLYNDFLADPNNPKWLWPYKSQIPWTSNGSTLLRTNLLDNGTVATVSYEVDVVNLGNADIWGRAATGGSAENPNYPKVGSNGSVRGEDTPAGVKVDPNRIALDFTASMPDPVVPFLSSPQTSITGYTIGSSGSKSSYQLTNFNISSGETYTVYGDVTMVVSKDVVIKSKLVLAPGASLKMYVGEDFEISGNQASIANPDNSPTRFMLYSTGKDDPATVTDETPQFKLAGNGAFYGAVYAPNASITLDGSGQSGEMFGAVVGKLITFGGGYNFHYDEALADYEDTSLRKVTRWVELTDAGERKNMATILTDGL